MTFDLTRIDIESIKQELPLKKKELGVGSRVIGRYKRTELYSQGKTYRQIAEEARICPRDIKTIVEKPVKAMELKQSMSASSQATSFSLRPFVRIYFLALNFSVQK